MIRSFENRDLDLLMSLWLDANLKAHNFISNTYWLDQFNTVKTAITDAEIYVYDENNSIMGFIGILPSSYIAGLFIKEEYQRQGIGKQLLNKAKEMHSILTLAVYKKKYSSP